MRPEAYLRVDPIMGHDLSLPFNMVKRGWRAVYAPAARAVEKMVPTVEGEFARKRRMMSHAWPIVLRGGLLSPRGYPPLYALMVASHRLLRYATPFLHLVALAANAALLGRGLGLRRHLRAPGRGAGGGARRARGARARAARRPLLRAHHGVDGGRAVGLPAPRHAGGLGPAGGHALMARRVFDVVVAGSALLVASPLLLAAVVAIRLESRGSAIYRQRRVGKDGRAFDVLKLRTMVTGAEHMGAGLAVSEGDTRITRIGRLLRRTSLDEVPNLINVLRGEMAIVGPRPTVPVQVDRYTERQRGRLAVKPGITGWAQVNGRTELPWDERIELDLWYIEHRSWRLDLRILLLTVRMVFGGHGLYRGEAPAWRDPPSDS